MTQKQEPVPSNGKDKLLIKWYLVTNHLNLYYMMGAGLIMSEEGFGKKYYKDTLSLFPGRILIFPDMIPAKAIDMSTEEASHLISCAACVNLSGLTGSIISIDRQGNVHEDVKFLDDIDGNEASLLIPAPLPVHWLDTIYFKSNTEMALFKEGADDFQNVTYRNFRLRVNKKLFKTSKKNKKEQDIFPEGVQFPWPGAEFCIKEPRPLQPVFDRAFAGGGLMAMLHQMADKSKIGDQAYRSAFFRPYDYRDISALQTDSLIDASLLWLQNAPMPATLEGLSQKMFFGALDAVAKHRSPNGMNLNNAVLNFLNDVVTKWLLGEQNKVLRGALQNLIHELHSITDISNDTISELLKRHPKTFSRALILFFLKEKCRDILEYQNEKLAEKDYLASAILFGVRDGWLGLPRDLRGSRALQININHRMAEMVHQISNTGVNLGAAPSAPHTFRQLFNPLEKGWNAKQKKAALLLAKNKKWPCINTRITLGKGDYQMKVGSGGGVQILIQGMEKSVIHEVDHRVFLEKLYQELSENRISDRLNDEVRKILGKK